MSTVSTAFSRALRLRSPIIQAPMAGGPTTPELVSAVSAAGALGSFGFAYTQPADMKKAVASARTMTDRPIGINLFVSPQPGSIAADAQAAALAALRPWYDEMGLPPPQAASEPYAPDLEAQLAAVAEIRPKVFTVHLADFPAACVREFKALGMTLGGSATTVAEAKRLESLGFDFAIAQGGEAGGHRGTYLRDPYEALTGTLALTRMIVRAVRVPVVAAGGIMDGEGIAAALLNQ